jgi:hypothetical protein
MKEPWFTIDLRWLSAGLRDKVLFYFWVDCSLFTRASAKSERKVDHQGHEEGIRQQNHFKVYFYKSL